MKKKNGFTLVELLAVIVVLAIIMIIAIPSVLETMNTARRHSFALYIDKVVTAVQTQYTYDSNGGAIQGAGLYVYDITNDLGLTSTGSYRGYVTVDARDVDDPNYVISMYDNNYAIMNFNVSTGGMPTQESESIVPYSSAKGALLDTAIKACNGVRGTEDTTTPCSTRKGYVIQESSSED